MIDSNLFIHRTTAHASNDSPALANEKSTEGSSLLEPASAGSLPILGQLHLLMIKATQQQREANRTAEEQFEAEEAAADAQRIQEMRDKADNALTMGLLSASLQVASAVSSSVATSRELSAMANRDAAEAALSKATTAGERLSAGTALQESKRALERAELQTKMTDGRAKAVDGARTGLDALARSQAADADEQIAKLEMTSKAARRSADRLKSEVEAAKQAETKILQLAKEISDAQLACERAALLRM